MSDINEIQLYIVNEYVFEDKRDYEAALQEKKGIKYLNEQLDLNNTQKVKELYNELIEKHVFSTPVGFDYLKKLRETVLKRNPDMISELKQIPILSSNHKKHHEVEKYVSDKAETQVKMMERVVEKTKEKRRVSIIINIALAIMVVAMFLISLSSKSVNILNYERALQDKYASWSEELKEKEQRLKTLERELESRAEELVSRGEMTE